MNEVYDLFRQLLPLAFHELLKNQSISEIMTNADGEVFALADGRKLKTDIALDASTRLQLAWLAAKIAGTVTNEQQPLLSVELDDIYFTDRRYRFSACLPPVVERPVFALRKQVFSARTLKQYLDERVFSQKFYGYLKTAVRNRKNIVIAGGTGSGKTTLANALLAEIPAGDRLVVIEDTRELSVASENVVYLKSCQSANTRDLVRQALRLTPDRIVVGEVRDGAALDLLQAWNTGHPGGIATVHANSAPAALTRLEQLVAMASAGQQRQLIADAVDVVVFITQTAGRRRVSEIIEVEKKLTSSHDFVYIEI